MHSQCSVTLQKLYTVCKVEIIVIKYFVKVRYVCTKIYEYAYTVDSIKFRHPVNFAPL